MPYIEKLADRIRIALENTPKVEEKKMFRGLTFMVDGKMCISVSGEGIMARVDPEMHERLLDEKPCRAVIMRGREYKGFIRVNEEDLGTNRALNFWIGLCLEYNPKAKASKKKR